MSCPTVPGTLIVYNIWKTTRGPRKSMSLLSTQIQHRANIIPLLMIYHSWMIDELATTI
jgi:hypothetical protein